MAHSYTPGLKVLKKTIFKKERILPLKGDVLVKSGDQLTPDTIVASTNLPGNVQMLKVSNILNIDPKDVVEALQVKEGQEVKKGDIIAETSGIFGMFKSSVESPVDGTIESISQSTGRVVVREAPIPVEVDAYVSGVVDDVVENEGIVLKSNAAFIQGIFGIEEASQQLFGLPASQLSLSEASLLAAVLPNPKQRSVKNPSLFVQRRALAISDGASTILKDERSQCFTD